MKKKIVCVLLIFALVLCIGCGTKPEPLPTVETVTEAAPEAAKPTPAASVLPKAEENIPATEADETLPAEIPPQAVTEAEKQIPSPEPPQETPEKEPIVPEVPVPETPAPEAEEKKCTVSISCASILNDPDRCDPAKVDIIPADGVILSSTTVTFTDGETVFDVLQRVCQKKSIPMEFSKSPMYHSAYIEGIANIYELDAGSGSGWMYTVNGIFPNFGCSACTLQDGDIITWVYTCDLGADVGGSNF